MTSEFDLLTDETSTVYAVNAKVQGSALHCGALYLEPLIPKHSIRLAYKDASVWVDLPTELLNQPIPFKAWEVDLPIRNE